MYCSVELIGCPNRAYTSCGDGIKTAAVGASKLAKGAYNFCKLNYNLLKICIRDEDFL
jgi:hypothetical protein